MASAYFASPLSIFFFFFAALRDDVEDDMDADCYESEDDEAGGLSTEDAALVSHANIQHKAYLAVMVPSRRLYGCLERAGVIPVPDDLQQSLTKLSRPVKRKRK